jgi:hypothetical protein
LRLDAETAGGSAWEFAARGFGKAKRDETFSWRVLVPASAYTLGIEAEQTFSEGPYEIVAVARNVETGEVVARRFKGSMPTVHGTRVAISSIGVMQSGPCGCTKRLDSNRMVRADVGDSAVPLGESVVTDRPVILVSLVCRGDHDETEFRVESSLSGATDKVTWVLADRLETARRSARASGCSRPWLRRRWFRSLEVSALDPTRARSA